MTTTTVEMPVAQGVPVQAAMDRGIEWTGGISGLYVAQRIELLEVIGGCETKNKYHIVQIPGGTDIPVAPTGDFNTQWRELSKAQPLLKAKEQSECCERICCPLFRGFNMAFKDGNGKTVGQLYAETCDLARRKRALGYTLVEMWGCEWARLKAENALLDMILPKKRKGMWGSNKPNLKNLQRKNWSEPTHVKSCSSCMLLARRMCHKLITLRKNSTVAPQRAPPPMALHLPGIPRRLKS